MANWRSSVLPLGFSLLRQLPQGLMKEFLEIEEVANDFINTFLLKHLETSEKKLEQNTEFLDFTLLNELNRRNFFSFWIPRVLGGRGYHPLTMTVFNERLSECCLGTANIVGAHYFGFGLLALSQNFKLMRQITTEIRKGEASNAPCVLSAAVTEPTAGTDREDPRLLKKAKLSCSAEKTENGYKLNGQKLYISNAVWARYHIVVTTTQTEKPENEILIIVVPNDSEGLKVESPLRKWGQNACPASQISFDECFIPENNIALSRADFQSDDEFFLYSNAVTDNLLAQSRAGVAAMAAGSCRKSLKYLEEYLSTSNLRHDQWVQSKVSEVIKNTSLARLIAWEAALYAQACGPQKSLLIPMTFTFFKHLPGFLENFFGRWMESAYFSRQMRKRVVQHQATEALGVSSLAKSTASDLAFDSALIATEILGSKSQKDNFYDLIKVLRDTKLLQIFEGTNQLNRLQCFSGLTKVKDFSVFENDSAISSKTIDSTLSQPKLDLMKKAYQICFEHSQTRLQGGRLITNWSEHQQLLTQLQDELENFDFLLLHSKTDIDCSRLSLSLDQKILPFISLCMQLMGGKGYLYKSELPDLFQEAFELKNQGVQFEI